MVSAFPEEVPGIRQEKNAECACCCVGIVLRLVGHPGADAITPAMLRVESQKYDGGYRPSPADVIPGEKPEGLGAAMGLLKRSMEEARQRGHLAESGPEHLGAKFDNIVRMLKGYGYPGAAWVRSQHILLDLQKASLRRPLILSARFPWGDHFVVACGHRELRKAHGGARTLEYENLFSDPRYGVGWLKPYREDGGPAVTYQPAEGVQGRLYDQYLSF